MCPCYPAHSCQPLPSTGITLLQRYYALIRLPICRLRHLAVYRLDIAYSITCEKSIMGLPSSHSLHLIPCCGLRPRWTHISLPSLKASIYIPRSEVRTNGGVNAAFRYTKNVGFQDYRNFGAYNLHLLDCGLVSRPPGLTSACYQDGCGVRF